MVLKERKGMIDCSPAVPFNDLFGPSLGCVEKRTLLIAPILYSCLECIKQRQTVDLEGQQS